MPEQKWEITNRELVVFFVSIAIALFVMAGGAMRWFDPLTAGIAITTMVIFFAMAQWLETKGIFGSGMSLVWIVFGLGVVMMFAGLIHRGIIPLFIYSSSASPFALELSNALIYAILVLAVVAVGLAVYVVYVREGIPLGAKKKKGTEITETEMEEY